MKLEVIMRSNEIYKLYKEGNTKSIELILMIVSGIQRECGMWKHKYEQV